MKSLKFIIVVAAFILNACSGNKPLPQGRYIQSSKNLENTVSAIANFPADNAVNVPLNSPIYIEFSGRLRWDTVDFFKFRVEDEFGIQVPGEVKISSDATTISFVPTNRSRQTTLNPNTTYTVKSRYLENQSGYLIGPYSWQFRTAGALTATGEFKVDTVLPDDTLLLPGQNIMVRFNEEVKPPEPDEQIPNEPQCSATLWNDSFQVLVVVPLGDDGDMEVRTLQARKICRREIAGRREYNTLVFYPANAQSILPGASYVDIVVKPTDGLRGNESGQMLDQSTTARKFVLPDPRLILNLLF